MYSLLITPSYIPYMQCLGPVRQSASSIAVPGVPPRREPSSVDPVGTLSDSSPAGLAPDSPGAALDGANENATICTTL